MFAHVMLNLSFFLCPLQNYREQLKWFEHELKRSQNEWKFVVGHHGIFCSKPDHECTLLLFVCMRFSFLSYHEALSLPFHLAPSCR